MIRCIFLDSRPADISVQTCFGSDKRLRGDGAGSSCLEEQKTAMVGQSRVCEAEATMLMGCGAVAQLAVAGRGGPVSPVSRLSSTGPRTDAH